VYEKSGKGNRRKQPSVTERKRKPSYINIRNYEVIPRRVIIIWDLKVFEEAAIGSEKSEKEAGEHLEYSTYEGEPYFIP